MNTKGVYLCERDALACGLWLVWVGGGFLELGSCPLRKQVGMMTRQSLVFRCSSPSLHNTRSCSPLSLSLSPLSLPPPLSFTVSNGITSAPRNKNSLSTSSVSGLCRPCAGVLRGSRDIRGAPHTTTAARTSYCPHTRACLRTSTTTTAPRCNVTHCDSHSAADDRRAQIGRAHV